MNSFQYFSFLLCVVC